MEKSISEHHIHLVLIIIFTMKILFLDLSKKKKITELIEQTLKETRSVTMKKLFRKKYFLFKLFVKVELCYVFTINMFSTAENCKEK